LIFDCFRFGDFFVFDEKINLRLDEADEEEFIVFEIDLSK